MNLVLEGVLASVALVGTGIFFLRLDMGKRSLARVTQKQMQQAGILSIILGAILAGFTVYIFMRGGR